MPSATAFYDGFLFADESSILSSRQRNIRSQARQSLDLKITSRGVSSKVLVVNRIPHDGICREHFQEVSTLKLPIWGALEECGEVMKGQITRHLRHRPRATL